MHKKDEIVVYRQSICRIQKLLPNYRDGKDYYQLQGTYDQSLKILAPVELADSFIRPVISYKEAKKIVDNASNYDNIEADSTTLRDVCAEHMKVGRHEDVLRVVKAHHMERIAHQKPPYKWNEGDRLALRNAEKVLYRELGAALGEPSSTIKKTIYERLLPAAN